MTWNFSQLEKIFSEDDNALLLQDCKFGLEKESLRIDENGDLSQLPHPKALGDKLVHPYITTDYSESQLELITPPSQSLEETLNCLKQEHAFIQRNIGDELLWPFSMPCHLPDDEEIPIAVYGDSEEAQIKEVYRRGIGVRYGRKMQLICGVHYNFSFSEVFWEFLYKNFAQKNISFQDFISDSYLKITRNFMRYRWLLVYLFGASPVVDESYKDDVLRGLDNCGEDFCLEYATSLRMSRYGYTNARERGFNVSYNSLKEYVEDIRRGLSTPNKFYEDLGLEKDAKRIQLNSNVLQIENEYYSPIRIKQIPEEGEVMIDSLERRGIRYIEVRAFDLHPFCPAGVEIEELYFVHVFLAFCLFEASPELSQEERARINKNQTSVALFGRDPELRLQKELGNILLQDWAKEIVEKIAIIAQLIDSKNDQKKYSKSVVLQQDKIMDVVKTPSAQFIKALKESEKSYVEFGLDQAKEFKSFFQKMSLNKNIKEKLQNS